MIFLTFPAIIKDKMITLSQFQLKEVINQTIFSIAINEVPRNHQQWTIRYRERIAGFTIDIDTGGTFTDGFIAHGGEVRTVKVPTTPHDLTRCFIDCIEAGAQAFGRDIAAFLHETEIVRFSNTIGTRIRSFSAMARKSVLS